MSLKINSEYPILLDSIDSKDKHVDLSTNFGGKIAKLAGNYFVPDNPDNEYLNSQGKYNFIVCVSPFNYFSGRSWRTILTTNKSSLSWVEIRLRDFPSNRCLYYIHLGPASYRWWNILFPSGSIIWDELRYSEETNGSDVIAAFNKYWHRYFIT